ncbi:MAG: hypothetical protein Q8K60_07785 [Parachlamydiaceae bacterium]|nr:hypothetical protein [Parachlamydiaceae bacterium]
MIKIDKIITGDRTLTITGKLVNTNDWKSYLEKVIKGIVNETDYIIGDSDLSRKINEQTKENPNQEINFIVQVNKP